MFSIPSCDLEAPQDLIKDLKRLSMSTLCSLSNSGDEEGSPCAGNKDASMKINW